jgi:hypothetical protein
VVVRDAVKQSAFAARGRASTRKGAVAENDVAKKLEAWLRQEHAQATVRRTPLSGGWGAAGEFTMRGDVQVRGAEFPWVVEVKRREGWSFRRFILGEQDSPVWAWWDSVCIEADKARLSPMLWVRQSAMEWIVVVDRAFAMRCRRAPMLDYDFAGARLLGPYCPVGYTLRAFLRTRPSAWR